MKQQLLITAVAFIGMNAFGQQAAPQAVLKSFEARFPKAQNVKWDTEKESQWEAEFNVEGRELSACFDSNGKWLETESKIHKKDLPAEIFKSLSLRFDDFEIEEAESIESPDQSGYEVILEKHETEVEVFIDKSGIITINDVKVDEEEEEDED
jgi:hypothetical protein